MIQFRISDPRSLASWCIKRTEGSLFRVDSSVPLMHHDPSDPGSLILIRLIPKRSTLNLEYAGGTSDSLLSSQPYIEIQKNVFPQ